MVYDVTIGIPVYKSVDCITRSLESALAQTYPSIEFLVVDDAGCDGSIDVVETMRRIHPRGKDIYVITHQKNLGVSTSRNQIIDEAHGKYLYFMDSDDIISVNTIELLMQNAQQYDAEIVFGSYEKIEISGMKTLFQYPTLQLLEKDELAAFAYRKYAGIQASACNFLVKISLLRDNHHRFIDTNYWEDFVFTLDLVTLVSRAVLLPDITYTYMCRENSLSNYQNRERISKDEIMRNVHALDHLKHTSSVLCDKPYYSSRCYYIVLTDFYIVCYILKQRHKIVPYISDSEIRRIISHPASFSQILYSRKCLLPNIVLYLLSKLPPYLTILSIRLISIIRRLL